MGTKFHRVGGEIAEMTQGQIRGLETETRVVLRRFCELFWIGGIGGFVLSCRKFNVCIDFRLAYLLV